MQPDAKARTFRGDAEARTLAQAKWASSGLTDLHAKKLRFAPLSKEETAGLGATFQAARSLLMPYFDMAGKPTSFFRIRYLEKLPGWAGMVEKPQRYTQPPKTLNEIYLPPLMAAPWEEIADDTSVPITITEGELKAACACAHGVATIGLGGVDLWRASKREIPMLPALKAFKWESREVIIAYDSDAATNPNVVRAQLKICQELVGLGALPAIAALPPAKDGKKQGLDDFLIAEGPKALMDLVRDAPAFPEAEALWEMNGEIVYVKNPGIVVVRDSGQKIDPSRFMAHAYANRHYKSIEMKTGPNGQAVPVVKTKKLAPRWIEWEHRFEARRITYAPGKPRIFDAMWNTWPGWGCEPKKGNIDPWKRLLDFIFRGHPQIRLWFERWCAYPLQHPGTKMYSSALIWGRAQGTGKSLIGYSLKGIYGKNGIEIRNKHLKAGFNSWQEDKQFVLGDEIGASEDGASKKVDGETLKGLITQPEIHINQKFIPEYTVPDVINYLFNSNRCDAAYMDDTDRRFMVHEVVGDPAKDDLYEVYDRWLGLRQGVYHGEGISHLFHHLLHLDLGDFKPLAHAPMTTAKMEMIRDNKSDIGLWAAALREDPVRALAPLGPEAAKGCDLWTPTQLLLAYDPERKGKVSANGLGRALKAAGFRQVNEGNPAHTAAGTVRLYMVRNTEEWERANEKQIITHYNKFFGKDAKKYG